MPGPHSSPTPIADNDAVVQLLADWSDKRKQLLEMHHDVDAILAQRDYYLVVIGRLSGTDMPAPGDVNPIEGRWRDIPELRAPLGSTGEDRRRWDERWRDGVLNYSEEENVQAGSA